MHGHSYEIELLVIFGKTVGSKRWSQIQIRILRICAPPMTRPIRSRNDDDDDDDDSKRP